MFALGPAVGNTRSVEGVPNSCKFESMMVCGPCRMFGTKVPWDATNTLPERNRSAGITKVTFMVDPRIIIPRAKRLRWFPRSTASGANKIEIIIESISLTPLLTGDTLKGIMCGSRWQKFIKQITIFQKVFTPTVMVVLHA